MIVHLEDARQVDELVEVERAPLDLVEDQISGTSCRTAERAGLRLVETVAAAHEAVRLGLGPRLCRYMAADS